MRLTHRPSRRAGLILAVAAGFLVVSCGSGSSSSGSQSKSTSGSGGTTATTTGAKLFPDDFQPVCQGATQSRATGYDKAAAVHKVLYFETYQDSLLDQSSQLPTDWTVTFDANANVYTAIDVVACAVRTSDTFVKDCDGYETDNKPTNNKVKLHTAKYTVSVHEASTGKVLGTTEMSGDSTDCPMLQSFDGDNETVDSYSTPSKDDLVAFIKPFVQP
jgi:hypothetical protein